MTVERRSLSRWIDEQTISKYRNGSPSLITKSQIAAFFQVIRLIYDTSQVMEGTYAQA